MREIKFKNTKLKPIVQVETFEDIFISGRNPNILHDKKIVLSNVSGTVYHRNYVEYLKIAYNHDYGIIISPNHVWFTILCSFSKIIKDDADLFKRYFSKEEGKVSLILNDKVENMLDMPIEKMLNLVLDKMPSKIKNTIILPKISTSTPEFKLACATSFLDTCSPYYDYRFYGCGYNKIKVLGTKRDYEILEKTFFKLIDIIDDYYEFKKLTNFRNEVSEALRKIINNYKDNKFWERILWTEHGYGGQKLDGWFIPFDLFDSHYAIAEYIEEETNKKYAFCTGLFSSKVNNGYLVPEFEKFIVEL